MQVTDLDGNILTVIDLEDAIKQADLCKGYAYENPNEFECKANLKAKAYWTDLHTKLLALRSPQDK